MTGLRFKTHASATWLGAAPCFVSSREQHHNGKALSLARRMKFSKGKAERARSAQIGLDTRYEHFLWKAKPVIIERSPKERAALMVGLFDAVRRQKIIFAV